MKNQKGVAHYLIAWETIARYHKISETTVNVMFLANLVPLQIRSAFLFKRVFVLVCLPGLWAYVYLKSIKRPLFQLMNLSRSAYDKKTFPQLDKLISQKNGLISYFQIHITPLNKLNTNTPVYIWPLCYWFSCCCNCAWCRNISRGW